jgi:hypothetical protein
VLLTPVGVFLFLTVKAVDEELARLSAARKSLEARLVETHSVDVLNRLRRDLEHIRERRATARRQRLLPIRQPAFLALVVACLVMLLGLPLSIRWFSGTPRTTAGGRTVADAVCAACGNAPLRSR